MNAQSNASEEAIRTQNTETQNQSSIGYIQVFLGILNDGKWWLAPMASLISILLLSKYLWVIGHPELILSSIGSPSNLLVWLIFTVLGFLLLLVTFSVPSLSFMLCMGLVEPGRDLEPVLAKHLSWVIAVGFGIMALNLLASTFDLELAPWLTFALVTVISMLAAKVLLSKHKELADAAFEVPQGQKKTMHHKAHRYLRMTLLGFLLAFTAMSGVLPAQIALLAWRGAENGWEARAAIGGCLLVMMIYLVPVILFYSFKGSLIQRAGKASLAMLGAIFLNAMLMPAIFDIWVYSAANLLKLRDNRPLGYVLDVKDYPKALFESAPWERQSFEGTEGLYSVSAFRQFRFGDVLLLCPGRYAGLSLKLLDAFSDRCIAVSDAKVKAAAKRTPVATRPLPEPSCLLAARVPTRIPLPIGDSVHCIYRTIF
ncbi:hypothetical protein ACCC96_08440 [Pseudomonas sp. Pseusp11]|uniref:hypothetical protein n=1 Tax=Pseudomonas sp. Pseusp11 TaxID=3243003 RepID=UPI0039B55FB5